LSTKANTRKVKQFVICFTPKGKLISYGMKVA